MNVDNIRRILRSLEKGGYIQDASQLFEVDGSVVRLVNNGSVQSLLRLLTTELMWPENLGGVGGSYVDRATAQEHVPKYVNLLCAVFRFAQELVAPLEGEKPRRKRAPKK